MRPLIKRLVPEATVQRFPRLSRLAAAGTYSLGSLPPRSAVVAFSAPRVYELGERLRARRGGAAVVLGALSPRARNAQVAMYQAGEVDYLVATDAIGMGLNLDVERIAFADRRKFDGRETRPLDLSELSQVAGRAGRYQTDGAFGVLAPEPRLPPDIERRIETHRLPEQDTLVWRNHDLAFDSVEALIRSLKERPRPGPLRSLNYADDFQALTTLARRREISDRATDSDTVRLLWEVCQIPDYRGLLVDHHPNLLGEIFVELREHAHLRDAWLGPRVERLNRTDGDIETLMQRIAFVRTWTYVSNRDHFVENARQWQGRTLALEDRLSDALHQALIARFIDSGRTASHGRGVAHVTDAHHPFSALQRLRSDLEEPRAAAGLDFSQALAEAEHEEFSVSARGRVHFEGRAVAQFSRGRVLVEPEIALVELALAPGALGQVRRRLLAFAKDFVSDTLGELSSEPDDVSPALRGLLYQLRQGLGLLDRADAEAVIEALDDDDRRTLGQLGVVIGQRLVFTPQLLDPSVLYQRGILARAFYGSLAPNVALTRVGEAKQFDVPDACYLALGFASVGGFVVRADVLEDLLDRASHLPLSPAGISRRCRVSRDEAKQLLKALGVGRPRPRRPRKRRRGRPKAPRSSTNDSR